MLGPTTLRGRLGLGGALLGVLAVIVVFGSTCSAPANRTLPPPSSTSSTEAEPTTTSIDWSQVALAANAPMLIRATMVEGRPEVGVLPTGQVTGVVDDIPTVADLLGGIRAQAEATLKNLAGG